MVDQTAVNDSSYYTTFDLCVGALYGVQSGAMVEAFPLPYLAPGQQVTGASISFYLEQKNSTPAYNIQLYGLNRVSATSSMPLESDWYTGSDDTANTLLAPTFVTPTTAVAQSVAYSGSNLVSFVQKQYTNAAFSGLDLSATRYIFFRLSPDATQDGYNNYQFASARNPTRTYHPTLALTIANGISNVAGRLQFSFNLPQASITSAGVYNPSTGALIRTLWNNVQYQQGMNYGVWDGNDDSGNPVATGSNYQIKLIYHNVQYVWAGTIGNTSTNQSGTQVYRAFGKIHDMAVAGNTAFYSVGYNEAENPYHSFTVGTPQVPSEMIQTGFNDVASCIYYVTSDATRSYWAKTYGGMNGFNTYVVAITNSTNAIYNFPQGTVPTGSNQSSWYTSCIDFDATANQVNPASGLAVQKSGNDLFVSHGSLNLVRVFDKVQGTLLGSFAVTNPGRMATTADGDVWVISNASTPSNSSVLRYTFANGSATLKETITGLSNPVGLGVSADDTLLLVADGGTNQQIKAFNNSTGASAWTYGTAGGMAVNGPNVTSNTFQFSAQLASSNSFANEAFIAFQPDNTFWIDDGGNGRILHFSINGSILTYIEQIAYNDTSYQSTVDLTNATRVFNEFMEYSVNYSLPAGGTNGSWTMVKNWAYGLPNDSAHLYFGYANGFKNVVTLSNGRTYGFLYNMITGNQDLFELPASGPARNTGYSYGNNPRIYADGTLRFNVDTGSSLSFYSQPVTGFDAKNNPVWGSPALIAKTALAPSDPAQWNAYPERTEITAGGMVVNYDGDQSDTGFHIGGIPSGGSAWQWRSAPSTTSSYTGWFPQDGRFDIGNGVNYAGDYHMALGQNVVCGYHGELWKGGQASQWLNFFDNGLMVGRFGTVSNSSVDSATNGFAGNAFAPTLVNAPDGNVYLYHNDESNHGGTVRWRINGWAGITQLGASGAIGGTASLSPSTSGPTVTITSPTQGAAYLEGGNLTLSAQAASSGASITSVQFFSGTTSLGTVTAAPFTLNYSGLSAGTHVITAQATDSNGLTGTSAAVTITIGADGSSAPPPSPISLSSSAQTSQSVSLTWTEPAIATTSSTIGQIVSFQCDTTTDGNALPPSTVAGAPSYATANFNLLGQTSVPNTVVNYLNNSGATVPNIGLGYQVAGAGGSGQSLAGTAKQLFGSEVTTVYNTSTAISIGNIPYALYDLVVYSLAGGIGSGTQTASVTVSDGVNSSAVQQSFTTLPTTYNVATVAFGSNASVSNTNTVVIQGLTSSSFKLQGGNIAGFQIVERPYDRGTPASYNIQRAAGTSGNFVTIGTASGTAATFTDTDGLSAGTTYEYRIQAVNSFGSSVYSNTLSVTTPTGSSSPTSPTSPTSSGFASWQTKYFTAAQLANSAISGPTANPYGSGVPNLLAYALQVNPATASPSDVPTPVNNNDGHLAITYLQPASITDINYIVEVSTDMLTWNSGAGYTNVLSKVAGSGGNTITVEDAFPTTTPKRYMRLRVTQLP
ncbi:MAG TPA: Ig-like domain-containing protein [Candidatus Methylacidiphilales bacterium]|nr:Ig-like domain-containing protein [Candidatus Methylacidiphilales bacterium]